MFDSAIRKVNPSTALLLLKFCYSPLLLELVLLAGMATIDLKMVLSHIHLLKEQLSN